MKNTSKEKPARSRAIYQAFLYDQTYLTAGEALESIPRLLSPEKIKISQNIRGPKYYEMSAAFDIETSSFYNPEKAACMYLWSLILSPYAVITGRTWPEFAAVIRKIEEALHLSSHKRIAVYVHNLAFEFQFMRGWFEWSDVFAVDARKPLYARTGGLEFRCSYLLSNCSLEAVGRNLTQYKARKMSGAIDYSKLRLPSTELSPIEIQYNVQDVKVVTAYIQEFLDRGESIATIPRTSTGFVRRSVRRACLTGSGSLKYRKAVHSLKLTSGEYMQLKRAFQGGFTHCNPIYSGNILQGVNSYDLTSCYPSVMIAEQFPMSTAEPVEIHTIEELEKNLILYCCLFDVTFYNLQDVFLYENYISESRCWGLKSPIVNNGRIVSAEELNTTLTEQDFLIIRKFYKWDHMKIYNFKRYKKGYLPRPIVKEILNYYRDKTRLKGIKGKEYEYSLSKALLNSIYGMTVTDFARVSFKYSGFEWSIENPDIAREIKKYNDSRGRFLFYPWGVWVTAYARRNLFAAIYHCGPDYVYSDTDSIKAINNHEEFFSSYNEKIKNRILRALIFHRIPPEEAAPKNAAGIPKPLGVWDFEGTYSLFKSLGAKRYLYEAPAGNLNLTVAGVNKKKGAAYLLKKYGIPGAFAAFNYDLTFPPEAAGKLTHTYIDDKTEGKIKDYAGKAGNYRELSGVHLEPAGYMLSVAELYYNYLMSLSLRGLK